MSVYRKNLLQMLAPDFDRNAHADSGGFDIVQSSPIGNRAPKFIGEELFNETGKVFYKGTGLGVNDWYTGAGGGGGFSDGDYTDISISGGGTVISIDNDVVTNAKLANMATQKIKGRNTTGTGDPEDLDPSVVFTMLGLGTAAQANTGAFAAASHTQLANTISDSTTAGRGMLTAANVAAQQALLSVDDLVALSGVNDGVQNLGTFTGTTIQDSRTIKAALQDLETALESASATSRYASQRAAATTGNITNADANGVVYITATTSAQTFTLVRTGFTAKDRVNFKHIGTAAVTLSTGTDGFNTAGNDTFTFYPGESVEVVYEGTADPYWRVNIAGSLILGADQYARLNTGGTAMEAVTDKREIRWAAPITADGTYPLWISGDMPLAHLSFKCRTVAGTCSIKIQKAASGSPTSFSDINGFGSAVTQSTTVKDTTSTDTSGDGTTYQVVVSAASSLTGLFITCEAKRTGD